MVLTTHPLLVPRLRMGRAIPVPPLQGHEACNRVNFTLHSLYKSNGGITLQISIAVAVTSVTATVGTCTLVALGDWYNVQKH
jgi:hypothetical protein